MSKEKKGGEILAKHCDLLVHTQRTRQKGSLGGRQRAKHTKHSLQHLQKPVLSMKSSMPAPTNMQAGTTRTTIWRNGRIAAEAKEEGWEVGCGGERTWKFSQKQTRDPGWWTEMKTVHLCLGVKRNGVRVCQGLLVCACFLVLGHHHHHHPNGHRSLLACLSYPILIPRAHHATQPPTPSLATQTHIVAGSSSLPWGQARHVFLMPNHPSTLPSFHEEQVLPPNLIHTPPPPFPHTYTAHRQHPA